MKPKQLTRKDKFIGLLIVAIFVMAGIAYASRNSYTVLAFNLLLVFAGGWMFVWISKRGAISLKSKHWIKHSYKIIETKCEMRVRNSRMQNQFVPFFKIEYEHVGKTYTRTSEDDLNLSLQPLFSTPHDAQAYLDGITNYRLGDNVYVNPDNPAVAFLRSGLGREQIGVLIFSLLLIVLPVLTMLGLIKWRL